MDTAAQNHTIASGSRLLALIVGIDQYRCPHVNPLRGAVVDARAVNDAYYRTHRCSTGDNYVLLVSGADPPPTRAVILDHLHIIAAQASPRDRVLLYLAGHGITDNGRAGFIPADGDPQIPASLLWIDELQQVFRGCPCRQRVLLLDACQESLTPNAAPIESPADPEIPDIGECARPRALRRLHQARVLSPEFLEALRAEVGWIILTSCGPGQASWEAAELGGHGVFSHHVALGLRGDADLNHDQTVGLDELVQYLSKAVPAEARAVQRRREELVGSYEEQVPYLICRAPVTAFTDEGGVTSDSRPTDYRGFDPPPGLLAAWVKVVRQTKPYGDMNNWSWHTPGAGVLYGLLMGVQVWLVCGVGPRWAGGIATAVAVGSALLWYAMMAFSVASARLRYHHGGYVSPAAVLMWHLLLFALLAPMAPDATHCIHYGVALFTILALVIVFGFNTLHAVINLFELDRRGEEAALRDFIQQLERKLLRAEIPNPIPCETFHPKLYLILWPILTIVLLLHITFLVWRPHLSAEDGLALLYDLGLWVLVTWLISGYNALYQWHVRRHPKQVRT